jgi:drug/metabolite transporter (DMT)-like permease
LPSDAARQADAHPSETRSGAAPDPTVAIGLIVLITLVWGASWPAMKISVGTFQPWTFRVLTTIVAGAVMLAMLRAGGTSVLVTRRRVPMLIACAVINTTLWMLCSAFALEPLPAGRSVIIAYTMPAWATLMSAIFLGERLTLGRLAGLALGLAGLAVLIGEDLFDLAAAPVGALLMLGGALTWSIGTVMLKSVDWGVGSGVLSAWQLFIGGVPIQIGAIVVDEGTVATFGWREGLAFAYVFVFAVLIGNWTWFKMISLLPASIASIGTIAIPVVGVGSSMVVLGEPLGWREFVALALVVGSLAAVLGLAPGGLRPRPIGRRLPPR